MNCGRAVPKYNLLQLSVIIIFNVKPIILDLNSMKNNELLLLEISSITIFHYSKQLVLMIVQQVYKCMSTEY